MYIATPFWVFLQSSTQDYNCFCQSSNNVQHSSLEGGDSLLFQVYFQPITQTYKIHPCLHSTRKLQVMVSNKKGSTKYDIIALHHLGNSKYLPLSSCNSSKATELSVMVST